MSDSQHRPIAASVAHYVAIAAAVVLFYAVLRSLPLEQTERAAGFSIGAMFSAAVLLAAGRFLPGIALALLGMLAIPGAASYF